MALIKSEYVLYVALIILLILVLMHFSDSSVNIYKRYRYFDYNGTTPPHASVIKKLAENAWLGNPSAQYATHARDAISQAQASIAHWLKSVGQDADAFTSANYVIFNSGASEGNNHIIRSVASRDRPHIVISAIEHKTSIDCAKHLAELGLVEVTFVEPTAEGIIEPVSVARAMNERTVLVSVMHINNETGAINDIAGISEAIRATSAQLKPDASHRAMFHVDAVQSFGKMPIPMNAWGIDALTMSFHKICGPAGLGALVLNRNVNITAQIAGTQNFALRGGTENVAAIAAVPETMRIMTHKREAKNAQLRAYGEYVIRALLDTPGAQLGNYARYYGKSDDYDPYAGVPGTPGVPGVFDIVPLGPADAQRKAPNTLYFAIVKHAPLARHFCNIEFRDSLFEKHRVVVSIGSACSASKTTASHVLNAMKAPYIIRCGVVRVSFGDLTTWSEVRALVAALRACIRDQLN